MGVAEVIMAMGVPTAITGFFFWLLKRKLDTQAKERQKIEEEQEAKTIAREKNRERLMLMLMQSNRAAIVLGEATARAVQRIPDAHCNGDMHEALDYVATVQAKQKDFLMELGVHSIYD